MNTERFIYKESYNHLFAKNLLYKWLKSQDEDNDRCKVAQFSWRSNYGVFSELPFYETSDPYYFELSSGLIDWQVQRDKDPLSWFDPNYNRGKILFQPDIVVFHKGTAMILFEVVYSNPVSEDKLDRIRRFFDGHYVELYEVSAGEILRHDSSVVPDYINCRTLLKG